MKLQDIDKTEAWSGSAQLPLGWHDVIIESAEEGESSNRNPQIELEYANEAAGSIREWLVVIPKTYGKLKALLDAAGIESPEGEWDFNPDMLIGKRLGIYVGEEADLKDPSQMRKRVQAHRKVGMGSDVPADTSGLGNGAGGSDDDIPF